MRPERLKLEEKKREKSLALTNINKTTIGSPKKKTYLHIVYDFRPTCVFAWGLM